MAEYIKRDELAKWLKDESDSYSTKDVAPVGWTLIGLINELSKIPSADVVERKHGKWIGIPHKTISKRNRTVHSMVYICPLCRYSNGRHKSNFCPNCGARMVKDG